MEFSADMTVVILAAAIATYLTRIGGYLLIERFRQITPRVEQALNAVPAAVLTTLVAPAFFDNGWDMKLALGIAFLASLRYPGLPLLAAGWLTAMACRYLGIA